MNCFQKLLDQDEIARKKFYPRLTSVIPKDHRNLPLKQIAFLLLDCREAMFGGAAGGGKTQALLTAALQYVDQSDYRALILRRTYRSLWLSGAIGDRAAQWLHGQARWNERLSTWTFPSGATLQFGYLAKESDVNGYLSAAYHFIGFDELTEIREKNYEALVSRLRRNQNCQIPLRVRSATNPGGPGHDWVYKRFVRANNPDRVYVPSTIRDNPYLDVASYVETLKALPRKLRDRFLHGDWESLDDGLLDLERLIQYAEDCLWPKEYAGGGNRLLVGVDLGRSRDLTVIWVWEQVGNRFITRKVIELLKTPWTEQAEILRRELRRPGVEACRIDKGAIGAMLAELMEKEFPGVAKGIQFNEHNQGAIALRMSSLLEAGRLVIPDKEEVFQDFRLVRMVDNSGGRPKISTDRDESGHADRFWAAALGLEAAELKPTERVLTLPSVWRSRYDPSRPPTVRRGFGGLR